MTLLGSLEHAAAAEIAGVEHRHLLPHGLLSGFGAWLRRRPPGVLGVLLTVTMGLPVSVLALPAAGAQVGAPATVAMIVVLSTPLSLLLLGLGVQRQSLVLYAFVHERIGSRWLAAIPLLVLFSAAEVLLALEVAFRTSSTWPAC